MEAASPAMRASTTVAAPAMLGERGIRRANKQNYYGESELRKS
jgi:hypothetical protein